MTAIFAHRGCARVPEPRENTIGAFIAARRAGADGVELDVRATADGALAVHHDPQLPGAGSVTNIAVSQLPGYVPLLPDALAACEGLVVNVEVKGGPPEAALVAEVLAERRPAPGTTLVSSFVAPSLALLRARVPDVPAGLLVDWHTDARVGLAHAVALGCATFHPFVTQVDGALVAAARVAGIGLHVWTVNAEADIAEMGALGVDAIITDRVGDAVRILRG